MRTGRGLPTLIASLLLIANACDRAASRPQGEVQDSAGVRIIQLPSIEALDPPRPLEIDSTWGAAAGLALGEIVDVRLTNDDRLLILDLLASTILLLSPAGEVQRRYGREGSGPGEFNREGLTRLVLTDSSVMIPDALQQQVTEFTFEGTLLGDSPLPTTGYAVDWRGHPDGGLAYRIPKRTGDILIHWHHEQLDTFHTFHMVEAPPSMLLPPVPLWDLDPSGFLVLGRTDKSSIESLATDPPWTARHLGEVRELDDAGRTRLENVLMAFVRRSDPGAISTELLSLIQYPTAAPVLSGLMRAPNGDLWVRIAGSVVEMGEDALRVSSAEGYGGRTWFVLTSDGMARERIALPAGFEPKQITPEWIYGVHTDELGQQSPARVSWPRQRAR